MAETAIPASVESIVVMGVSGVGKSTVAQGLAAATGWALAEGDAFHPAANVQKMRSGTPLEDEDRWPWLRAIRDWITEQDGRGRSSVITCSGLKRAYRDVLREGNPSVRFCALVADEAHLTDRVEHRTGHYMPASLLRSQLDILEPLGEDEPGVRVPADDNTQTVIAAAIAALHLRRTPAGADPQLPGGGPS